MSLEAGYAASQAESEVTLLSSANRVLFFPMTARHQGIPRVGKMVLD